MLRVATAHQTGIVTALSRAGVLTQHCAEVVVPSITVLGALIAGLLLFIETFGAARTLDRTPKTQEQYHPYDQKKEKDVCCFKLHVYTL